MAWALEHSSDLVEKTTIPALNGSRETIAILLPHRGKMDMEVIEKTWGPLKYRPVDWCNKLYFLCRVPSLPLARNILVKEALKSQANYFLWLDADHSPEQPSDPNEALKALYQCLKTTGESIVTGLYRAKQQHGFNYAIWKQVTKPDGSIGFVHINSWSAGVNWFEIDVCGLGFCLMRREVFEKMEMPYFHWEVPDTMSEDFDMLCKARKLGFRVWCFTDVKLSHLGTVAIRTDGSIRVPLV